MGPLIIDFYKFFFLPCRLREHYEQSEKGQVPKCLLKNEIEKQFPDKDVTGHVIGKAVRKCFPIAIPSRGSNYVQIWRHIRKKPSHSVKGGPAGTSIERGTTTENQQLRQIADINTVEQLLKAKGYLILSKSEHVITSLLPINYEVNETKTCLEVCIDFVNLEKPGCVRFLGRQVPLDKVFKKLDFNIYNVVEISEFLEELKKVRPCCGYETVTLEDTDYLWKNLADPNEIVSHRKRARACKLLICPSDVSPTCQSCRYNRLMSRAVDVGEGIVPNTTKEKPIRNKIEDIALCEDDNRDMIDIITFILDKNNMEFTEDQKQFMESQVNAATTKHPKQHKWQKRLVSPLIAPINGFFPKPDIGLFP